MKKLLIKYISIILTVLTLIACIPINASAWFSDVPANAAYSDALTRLTSLGIIASQDKFNPDGLLTREQFAKVIVTAAGLDSKAESMKGPTVFPDIASNAWSSGYINAAVSKGYIAGMADGKFHPTQAITFAQVCTILVRALGYTDQDVSGNWPTNYISKAKELGMTDGITLGNNAGVPRWAAVLMVDKLLDMNMKNSTATAAQTFIGSTGNYIVCTVFGDSNTTGSLTKGQVLTDKGIFNNPSNIKLELGSENYLVVKNGNIIKASGQSSVLKVSVDQATDNKVSYKVGDSEQSMLLPDSITYYYLGQKIEYAKLATILQKSASIVFNYNADKTGYSFAVVFDPVYSKPEIAENFIPSSGRLGSIIFGSSPLIIRDGEIIDISQIVEKDVVYQVSDIWGSNKYIQAVDKKIGGKITDILPNKLSPKTLQIDSVNYDFSQDIDTSKITGSYGDLTVGNNIVVYLGHDGKIVNIEGFGTQNNSDYAVVLNNGYSVSTNLSGTKSYIYTAKLLFSDGVTATYDVTSNASEIKGKLVKYKFNDAGTVSLEQLSYNFPGETYIKKDERLMGDSYAADNVKIFNVVYNDSGTEVTANILKWSDLPGGTIPNGKIWYTNTTGDFNDINVIFTDDILGQRFKTGIIKSVSTVPSAKGSSYAYKILIDGKEYNYNVYNSEMTIGNAFKFKMNGTGIDSLSQSMYPSVTGTNVQAVDSRRIKVKDEVYYFNSNVSVYLRDSNGAITTKTLADIDTTQTYQKVALYTDDSSNASSKVNVVYLVE